MILTLSNVLKRILFLFVGIVSFGKHLSAQQVLTKVNGWNAYVHLPDDYTTTQKTYPVIVFIPAATEVGTDAGNLLKYGPAYYISNGHNMQFAINGVVEKPIVVSLQPTAAQPTAKVLNTQLDSVAKRWRIDTTRLYVTGPAMGGWAWDNYISAQQAYAARPAAVVSIAAPPADYPVANYSWYANSGGKWWGFEGTTAYRKMDSVNNQLNKTVAGSAKYTPYVGGDCCWNLYYNPDWTENGDNVYTWMLKQKRPVTKSIANQAPAVNAGTDQTITLPANSVTLKGTATDADGSVASYQWTKISGPAAFTIGSATSAQTTVSSLVKGVYAFELKATDNAEAIGRDTVQVTVKDSVNKAPTAKAGADQQIQLPLNTVTLTGSGTDADGSIVSYIWAKISGPAATITSASAAQTTVSGLTQGTYWFTLTVTDNGGQKGTDSIRVVVLAANQLPVAQAGNDQTLTLPVNTVTLTGSGTDADGNIASYSWIKVSGPSGGSIATPTQATTTVSGLVQGLYQFALTVTDNQGGKASDTIRVTVNAAPNKIPVVNAGADMAITLPVNTTTLKGSASDSDGTIASYQWKKIAGPSSYSISNPAAVQTTAAGLVQGVYVFELTVTDNAGATAKDSVAVTVNAAPNKAPIANAGNDQTITLPTNTVTIKGGGSDSDGTIVSYQWKKISGPSSGTITNPSYQQTGVTGLIQGTYMVELTVADNGGLTGKDTVKIVVNPAPNKAPTANAGADQTIQLPTNTVTLKGSGNDTDGTISSYAWRKAGGPTAGTIATPSLAQTTVSGLAEGTYVFELTISDNKGALAKDSMRVVVLAAPVPVNQAPKAYAGNDMAITLPVDSVRVSGKGTDADGIIVAYKWTKISGPVQYTITAPAAAQTDIKKLVAGIYAFALQVTDDKGAISADTVQVTVKQAAPVNQLPVVNAGSNQTVQLPINSITLQGSAQDADGTITSVMWSKVAGPASYSFNNANQLQTVVSGLTAGIYQFQLKATDNAGASALATVQVTVLAANKPPAAYAGNDQTITLPINSVSLSGKATDSDGTIVSYQWRKVSGPAAGTIMDAYKAATAVTDMVKGTYAFELSATDNAGVVAKDTVVITVKEQPAENVTVNVYPNPATTYINVKIKAPQKMTSTQIMLSDVYGNVVYNEKFTRDAGTTTKTIDISGLKKGSYLLQVYVGFSYSAVKVTKN